MEGLREACQAFLSNELCGSIFMGWVSIQHHCVFHDGLSFWRFFVKASSNEWVGYFTYRGGIGVIDVDLRLSASLFTPCRCAFLDEH